MFNNFDLVTKEKIINKLDGKKLSFKKDTTVMSNISNIDKFGYIIKGKVDLIKYDLNGNITILDSFKEDDLFGSIFSTNTEDSSIITKEDSEIIFFNLYNVLDKLLKKENNSYIIINNLLKNLNNKITVLNNRIEILTERTTRDKLMKYFENERKRKASNTFVLKISFTDLADFLSVDRSAMMRELKHLKDEGFIAINNKKITIYW